MWWTPLYDKFCHYYFDGIGWDVGRGIIADVGIGVHDVVGSGPGIDWALNVEVITSVSRGVGIRVCSDFGG